MQEEMAIIETRGIYIVKYAQFVF